MYSRTTVDGMMIIIVKPNVIYMTHQLIARRIQEKKKNMQHRENESITYGI